MSDLPDSSWADKFTENGLWEFVKIYAQKAGKTLLIQIFLLYYVIKKPTVSKIALACALAALGYDISPIDLIPDPTPIVGLSDDAAITATTLAYISSEIDDTVTRQAEQKVNDILA